MNNKSKKALGLGLAGIVGVSGVVAAAQSIKVANAEISKAQQDAKAKISHTIYSINKNYAGIKNQAQWEIYIKEARALIAKIPIAEKDDAEMLTQQVNGLADTVLAIARINQVEKSMAPKEEGGFGNYLGIKNAAQWREYLRLAKEDMKSIDLTVFQAKYDELAQRYNDVDKRVTKIEEDHNKELEAVEKLYEAALKSLKVDDAETALEAAKKLGTHETSKQAVEKIENLLNKLKENTVVKEVSIVNAKSIKIKGEGLTKLTSSDIKVEGNTIASMNISEDLSEISIGLIENLIPNYETTITIKVDGQNKEFKVINGLVVENVTVNSGTFGTDRVNQKVTLKVNGNDTTVEYLRAAGYEVRFVATTTKGEVANIFEGNSNASTTGILNSNNQKGNYKVEAQIIKNGEIIVSGESMITIVNLNANATIINDIKLSIGDTKGDNEVTYAKEPEHKGSAYKLNSTTLVSGESAVISSVLANINGDNTLVAAGNITASSSNVAVAFVSKDSEKGLWKITANGPGTVTITVKVGNAEKKINLTITNNRRTLGKVELGKSIVTLTKGKSSTLKLKTLDQYGDPIAVGADTKKVTTQIGKVDNVEIASVESINTGKSGKIGEQEVKITANETLNSGTAKINFVDEYKNPNTQLTSRNVLASLTVNITGNNVATTRKLEVVKTEGHSSDFNLDGTKEPTNKKSSVIVKLNEYNSENELLGSANFEEEKYIISSLNEDVITIETSGDKATISAVKGITGKATVVVKNSNDQIVAQQEVTVTNNPTEIKAVKFKEALPTITYNSNVIKLGDVLEVEETNGDAIVKGLTLTKESTANVRISKDIVYKNEESVGEKDGEKETENKDKTETLKEVIMEKNDLYLDIDGDGKYDETKDIKLGSITATVVGEDIPNPAMVGDTYFVEQLAITPERGISADATVIVNVLKDKNDLTTSVGTTQFKVEVKK